MANDLVYVVHSDADVAKKLSNALLTADYKVVAMSSDVEAEAAISGHQFVLPDAILTPLGDLESGDSILIKLFNSNPLMEQIPVVVLAGDRGEERRRALRLGLLSVILPPYDDEEVALTTQLAIEKHRNEQLLFGSLAQLSVPDLLQTAEVGRRSGIISFQHVDLKGTVWMRDGLVINSVIEGVCEGEEAVYSIALWGTGTFEANFCPVDVEEHFAIHPSELLLEAMRRLDEGLLSPTGEPIKATDKTPQDKLDWAVHTGLVVINAAAGYATNHMEAPMVERRLRIAWERLVEERPDLRVFQVKSEASVEVGKIPDTLDAKAFADAAGQWVLGFFVNMEAALAWRFSLKRLAKITEPWHGDMRKAGLFDVLGIEGLVESMDEDAPTSAHGDNKLPLGCFVLDCDGDIESYGPLGSTSYGSDPSALIGQSFTSVLPPDLARVAAQCLSGEAPDGGEPGTVEISVDGAHQDTTLRLTVVDSPASGRRVVTVIRLRDREPLLSPGLERDLFKGTITDGAAMRILAANDDFLHAFNGLFARSLAHRRHEMLHRFGKKWGLRHSVRVEQLVQHEYHMTLREVESQLAIEVLSGSLGVLGLGRFEADLNFRESGIVVISHFHSPFAVAAIGKDDGSCSILAGFHAALLSYLAGRQLAARELQCSASVERPCVLVVATEDRLSKLFTATTGSADHKLLARIVEEAGARAGGRQSGRSAG